MNTITLILDVDSDGTVHLPVPPELRNAKVKITATVVPANGIQASPPATPEMIKRRIEAFEKLRKLNPYRHIKDPVAWQRKLRRDRPLPGRE